MALAHVHGFLALSSGWQEGTCAPELSHPLMLNSHHLFFFNQHFGPWPTWAFIPNKEAKNIPSVEAF